MFMVASVHAVMGDRHVHDRRNAEAEDQFVIGEGLAQFVAIHRDEDFAAIEHLLAPGRAPFRLAAADRIGGLVVAIDALDLAFGRAVAHHGEQAVPEDALRELGHRPERRIWRVLPGDELLHRREIGEGELVLGHSGAPVFSCDRNIPSSMSDWTSVHQHMSSLRGGGALIPPPRNDDGWGSSLTPSPRSSRSPRARPSA
jgi:hypothetical protein